MQIAGIKKTTLLDYPGKVACIIFTPGCNFRCPFCYNPEFVLPKRIKETMKDLIPEEAFFEFLKERKDFLEGVVLCGGEPTLQHDLMEFCEKIKKIGLLIKLDTNGRDPKILQQLIDEQLIDFVAMDIKHSFENYDKLCGIKTDLKPFKESIQILLRNASFGGIAEESNKEFKISNLKFKNNLKVNNGKILNGDIENCLKIKNGKLKINEMDLSLHSRGHNNFTSNNIDYEFRTTVVKGYHAKQDIESIAKSIKGAKKYAIQNFIGGNTLDPNFDGQSFSTSELEELKEITEKYVKVCEIRN